MTILLCLLFGLLFAFLFFLTFICGYFIGLREGKKKTDDSVELTKDNASTVKEMMEWMNYYGQNNE